LEKGENNILVTLGKKIDLVKFKTDKNDSTIYTKKILNSLFTLEIGENFIVCCQKKVLIYDSNLSQRNIISGEKVLLDNSTIKAAIKIDNFVLLKSNKICSLGNDHIIIYNLISYKRVYNKLDEYSFVYSQNGLSILSIDIKNEKNNNLITKKILLCACKQYIKNQKNGILLITNIEDNGQNIKDIDIQTYFFDTNSFEVYCFCPIFILESSNFFKKNNTKTNYFLAGGFEKAKNKGIIKLFKVIYIYEKSESRIEFIQDIEIIDPNYSNKNKFISLKKPISCITRSSSDENLLVTCWDGNVYLLENLNIDAYLNYDKLIEKNISLDDLNQFHFIDNK
jgi:hypothetical protein